MDPSSTATNQKVNHLLTIASIFVASVLLLTLLSLILVRHRTDPYLTETFLLEGSQEQGAQLFRINCAGCHGVAGQGLLGPSLIGISNRFNDKNLIHQIISGSTPPMPSFQMEPQEMADLLSHLQKLN